MLIDFIIVIIIIPLLFCKASLSCYSVVLGTWKSDWKGASFFPLHYDMRNKKQKPKNLATRQNIDQMSRGNWKETASQRRLMFHFRDKNHGQFSTYIHPLSPVEAGWFHTEPIDEQK